MQRMVVIQPLLLLQSKLHLAVITHLFPPDAMHDLEGVDSLLPSTTVDWSPCLRFEAKHQYFKNLSSVVCNYKNTPNERALGAG